jgi:solute carrier family 35 protein E1
VKALEPAFAAVLSRAILGKKQTRTLWATLSVIVVGVTLTSSTEIHFGRREFIAGMASNLVFQLRNVLTKRTMLYKSPSTGVGDAATPGTLAPLVPINLFMLITCLSFSISLPIAVMLDADCVFQCVQSARNGTWNVLLLCHMLACAFSFHTYQWVSFMVLERVEPLTHSVANCLKRGVIILSALVTSGISITLPNATGIAITLVGVCAYAYVSSIVPKSAAAQPDPLSFAASQYGDAQPAEQ